MNPYEELGNAIIIQASKDYLKAKDLVTRIEVEQFFWSKFFALLTGLKPDDLISRLKKEIEANGRKKVSRPSLPH